MHQLSRASRAEAAARRDDPAPSVVAQTTIPLGVTTCTEHAQSTTSARHVDTCMNDKEKHTVDGQSMCGQHDCVHRQQHGRLSKHRSRGCAAAWTFEMIMVSRAHAQERQGSTNIPFFWFSTIVSAFAKELGALNEARFSAHASSSEKRYRTRTVGRFSVPESLAPPHVRARPRGTAAKSPFYSKKVVENQINPSYRHRVRSDPQSGCQVKSSQVKSSQVDRLPFWLSVVYV